MRATTIMTLGLAAPVFSKDFQYTCDYLSKTDRGAVPDKLKFRCELLAARRPSAPS